MDIRELLQDPAAVGILSFVAGITGTVVSQQITGRRRLLSYTVSHYRVGVSSNDALFGAVQLTWNSRPVANLFFSTIVLTNESLSDLENVVVTIYTGDTNLLTQRTHILETPLFVRWTPAYEERLRIPAGQQPTPDQQETYNSQREFLVPTLNRGQKVQFDFLNAPKGESPTIWMSLNHPGVKLKFHEPRTMIWGVDQLRAVITGLLINAVFMVVLITQVETVLVAAAVAFLLGLFTVVPGTAAIKLGRVLRNWYGG